MSAAAVETRFPGLPVVLGGRQYVLPPISAKAGKAYWQRIQAMQAGTDPDPLGLVADLVVACLRRNYPEVDADEVADLVDMDNMDELSAKVFGAGAFRRWCAMQQPAAEGNAQAPQPTVAGTGAPSTHPSPPPPDGDGPTSTS